MLESELKPRYSDVKVHAHDSYALSVPMCPDFVQNICSPYNPCTVLNFSPLVYPELQA